MNTSTMPENNPRRQAYQFIILLIGILMGLLYKHSWGYIQLLVVSLQILALPAFLRVRRAAARGL